MTNVKTINVKCFEVPPLPLEHLSGSDRDSFASIERVSRNSVNSACLAKPDHLVAEQMMLNESYNLIAFNWLLKKKYGINHKIPGAAKVRKAIEPLADVYLAIFELCIQLHSMRRASTSWGKTTSISH
jgi:hypothetical protein